MQNCFREYPEHYGAELQDDEDDAGVDAEGNGVAAEATEQSSAQTNAEKVADRESAPAPEKEEKKERAQKATEHVKKEHEPVSESEEAVPKEWHNNTSANEEKK